MRFCLDNYYLILTAAFAGLRRIGSSVSVMGKRNFVVFAAISAFYNKVMDLFVFHILKKSAAARSAIVIHGSAALDGGSNEDGY